MKKILSLVIVMAMVFMLAACGGATQAADVSTASASEQTKVSGTIKSVEDDSITITTDDGSEKTFTVTEDTVYSIEMGDYSGSQQGGTPPEQPSGGNGQQGGTPPEQPSGGNGQQGGTPPEQPNGENGQQGGTPPEQPSGGNGQQGGTPPEQPSGGNDQQGGIPPELPSGENSQQGGTPPELPDGENSQQTGAFPEMPDMGQLQTGISMLSEGMSVTITVSADGTAANVILTMSGGPMGGAQMGAFGGGADIDYTAANTYSESVSLSHKSFSSSGKDENAVLVTGGDVSLDTATIERVSSNSTGGDNASFYGVGAAVLATDGTVSISNSKINTDSAGGTGVFAYGNGTAYVADTDITTEQNTSGGIHVAGGGTLYAWNLDVETNGESAAAIRSDRGSGTMVVDGGKYTSNGIGSPAIYSTADISVNNAVLTATGSEAICIEGKNSVRLYDCTLSGNMSDDSRNDCTWNVILYQSMSGDSDIGNSLFEMVGGKLKANNGGIFYTTNTESTFTLSGVDIETAEGCEFLLKCTGNANQRGWGSTGSNGADCTFTAIAQKMSGDVIWDSVSTLNFYMTQGSVLTGAFVNDESAAGEGGSGYAALYIGEGCTWTVTADSTLSSLYVSGGIVDENGQSVTVVGTDGTVYVSGDSDISVTVESFSDAADLSACATASCFADFAVERK